MKRQTQKSGIVFKTLNFLLHVECACIQNQSVVKTNTIENTSDDEQRNQCEYIISRQAAELAVCQSSNWGDGENRVERLADR